MYDAGVNVSGSKFGRRSALHRTPPAGVPSLRASELLSDPTGFFREEATLVALGNGMLGGLWTERRPDETFRAWVPSCSTGEEVYSVGITIMEMLDRFGLRPGIQIFGTDVNGRALETARAATYPEPAVSGLPAGRLARFVNFEDGHYKVRRELREICLFAQQNLASDPPLARMDLVVFRNQLARMIPGMQLRILNLLHYSLKPGGVLALGLAETVEAAPHLFTAAPGKPGIFVRRENGHQTWFGPSSMQPHLAGEAPHKTVPEVRKNGDRPALVAKPRLAIAADGRTLGGYRVRAMLEELTHTIEALRIANEEIACSNEELMATNEELMAARENLQAANQELAIVNQEMKSRNRVLARTAAELSAFLRHVPVAIVTVDGNMRIRRCTKPAEKLFGLRRGDSGRWTPDLPPKLRLPDFEVLLRQAVDDLTSQELEVSSADGLRYRLSIRPHGGDDGRIEGALLAAWPL